jgi:hypothetical protein
LLDILGNFSVSLAISREGLFIYFRRSGLPVTS